MAKEYEFNFSGDLGQFAGGSTKRNIKRPREFAYYSLDDQRKTLPLSTQSLKYSYPCMSNAPFEFGGSRSARSAESINQISLRDGFASFEKYDDSQDEHLDAILETIEAYEKQYGERVQPNFLMFRGMMTKILTTPYTNGNDAAFELNTTVFQDTIFIEQNKAYDNAQQAERSLKERRKAQNPRTFNGVSQKPSSEEMQYWGYKFEALCSLDRPYVDCTRSDVKARKTAIVNNASQYCSIVNTGIDDMTIVLAGEVDAIRGVKPDDPEAAIPWVEFKTNRALESDNDYRFWSEKLLRIWTQSYLLAVPLVVVGFRSQHGQLLSIEQYETSAIPGMAKSIAMRQGKSAPWDGTICINFASAFLQFLRSHINEAGVVWRIQRRPGEHRIRIFVVEDISPDSIITTSFVAHRKQ